MIKFFVVLMFLSAYPVNASTPDELREMLKTAPVAVNEFDIHFIGKIEGWEKNALIKRCGELNKLNLLGQKSIFQTDSVFKHYKITLKKEYLDATAVIHKGRTTTKPGHTVFHLTIGNLE